MKKLLVDLKENSYNIYFKDDFSGLVDALKDINAPKKIMIVTDTNVERLYSGEVFTLLKNEGYEVFQYAFEAGEKSKNMDTILKICSQMLKHKIDRNGMILALGGGVVGDMAGFAASIYMRGIKFIGVPTTLLSQSDSSVGGKTGIDFQNAKNILGAFHQPKLVYINVSALKTLPEREFISGMGEVIKHAVIRDGNFFDKLYSDFDEIKKMKPELLIDMAYKNCSIKSGVVVRDEFEKGQRCHLNLGHTIGHAIESLSNFSLSHGECVGLGMLGVFYIALKRNLITKDDLEKLEKILDLYGFNKKTKIEDKKRVMDLIRLDKKKTDDTIRFILPVKIGDVGEFLDVSDKEIEEAIDYISK